LAGENERMFYTYAGRGEVGRARGVRVDSFLDREVAGMTTRATAAFEVTGWEQTDYDEPTQGPKLARATVRKTFRGEVEGESVAELLMCQAEAGAGYVASERIVGRVGGRAGSFVVQHGGVQAGEATRNFGYVVPGSGTGELRGLRGEATFRHDAQGAVFTLDYDLT
jgi:hypothetical protein